MTTLLVTLAVFTIAALAVLWRIRRDRRQRIADLVRLDRRISELGPPLRRRPHAYLRL